MYCGSSCRGYKRDIQRSFKQQYEGDFRIDGIRKGSYLLSISFIGFREYKKDFRIDKNINLGKIILQEEVQSLNELVITGKTVKRFSDKKEYKITAKDKENYSDALSAMEYLPRIKVVNQQ
ncbi:MAG: hypothetical protein Q4A76_05330, partial [Porphyromonadaceae bacterium]|nr:hypothetical protein [Porphyromonadaceae bacterium]